MRLFTEHGKGWLAVFANRKAQYTLFAFLSTSMLIKGII